MVDVKSLGVEKIVAIAVALLLVGALLPSAVGTMTSTNLQESTEPVTLQSGESYNLSYSEAKVTLDSINTGTVSYTVSDGAETASYSLAENESNTKTVNGTDYQLNVTSVTDSIEATALVTYKSGNVSGGTQALWEMIPLFIVLSAALYFIYISGGKEAAQENLMD